MRVLELDKDQLIAFANGKTIGAYTITTPASGIVDSGPALEQILGVNAWTLAAKVIGNAREIYTITHA